MQKAGKQKIAFPFRKRITESVATAFAALLLSALVVLGASTPGAAQSIQGATDDEKRVATLRVHDKLAALGYPIDADDSEWSSQSRRMMFRLQRRMGMDLKALGPLEADQLLAGIDPEQELGCFGSPGSLSDNSEMIDIEITFLGDRPEEYLADMYLRLAQCHPEVLSPRRVDGSALQSLSVNGDGVRAFPTVRTGRAAETYVAATRLLGKTVEDGAYGSDYAEPDVVVERYDYKVIKVLTEAKFENGANDDDDRTSAAVLTAVAPTPDIRDMERVCSDLGYHRDCIDPSKLFTHSTNDGRQALAVNAAIDHFSLTLKLSVPEQSARAIAIDAIDFVRSRNEVMRGVNGRDLPQVYYGRSSAGPTDVSLYGLYSTIDKIDERFDQIRNAVEWLDNDEVAFLSLKSWEPLEQSEVSIVEYAFDEKQLMDVDVLDPAVKTLGGNIEKLTAISRLKNETDARKPISAPPRENDDDVSHGVHVAFLVGGKENVGNQSGSKRHGFLGQDNRYEVNFRPPKKWDDAILDPSKRKKSPGVVNRSYRMNEEHCATGEGGIQLSAVLSPAEKFEHSGMTTGDHPKPFFDVVAAPYIHSDCLGDENTPPTLLTCNGFDTAPLACLGWYAGGIGVAPMDVDNGRLQATVVEKFEARYKKSDGTTGKATTFVDYLKEVPWIGAPGINIVSADVHKENDTNVEGEAGYRPRSGSSMAAPIVSALVSRLRAKNPDLKMNEVKQLLFASATPLDRHASKINEKFSTNPENHAQVFGMVSYAKALLAVPDRINIWVTDCRKWDNKKDLQPIRIIDTRAVLSGQGSDFGCLIVATQIALHSSIKDSHPFIKTNSSQPFALIKYKNEQDQYVWQRLREETHTNCANDGVVSPCFWIKRDDNIPFSGEDCWFTNEQNVAEEQYASLACLSVNAVRRDKDGLHKVKIGLDLNDVSHIYWLKHSDSLFFASDS